MKRKQQFEATDLKITTIEYIKSDCYRYLEKCDYITMLKFYLRNSTFRWQVAFRFCNGDGIYRTLGNILWKMSRAKNKIDLEKNTKIGCGFYIEHNGSVVINGSATIGNNCNISQFVTIGSNHDHAAIIGDNVYIGPNVCVVEDFVIGDRVTIGAGSVVTKDIPNDATAAGNYAKVLNYNNPGRYIKFAWVLNESGGKENH